ncbi:electron transfer flavoprotein subunit alpha/FixB family protein [Polynucleobacter rarus]|jgi:electron transfer flavoprotein alpha subunit|uniref:electron transfer flavoprotein subunit alpha/FixB family protein n=1 Tax=Polynucleobacter rarus TaxID=556055 RepID=UPI000D3E58A0|nr:FAD-binding protein [Polynucleobacter rarus]
MVALVIAEHQNNSIQAGTLNVVTAATQLSSEVHVLVVGSQAGEAAVAAAKIKGVSKVLLAQADYFANQLAEPLSAQVVAIAQNYSHILTNATPFGKNILPRIAALLDVAQISEVTHIVSSDTFERPIYAGNAIATVQATDAIKVMTVRATSFEPSTLDGQAIVEEVVAVANPELSNFTSNETVKSDRPELTAAKIIVSGGRGLGSAENYHSVMEPLADRLGAALGASRAAVDAGYVPNDYQVGQTGKIVAPQLYVAVGISGAIQHLAGMKDSKVIVAINKDPDAPIFGVADYGLVADLFSAVPELLQELG